MKTSNGGQATCKTCKSCRQKKVKCDGSHPCQHCKAGGSNCVFPRDARRESRPSKARVHSLENTVARMLDHMKASGIAIPDVDTVDDDPSGGLLEGFSPPNEDIIVANEIETIRLPTPSVSARSPSVTAVRATAFGSFAPTSATALRSAKELETLEIHHSDPVPLKAGATWTTDPFATEPSTEQTINQWQIDLTPRSVSSHDEHGCATSALSHCEARVAGVFHEHGSVSIHGLSGVMNPNLRQLHKKNISSLKWKGEAGVTESTARLISNAALQKQREITLFRQPQSNLDLDRCAPELAKCLLDLHFNRQHHGSVLTYRPAFMDSLANGGGGPWANKLLLNAIYYSSAMFHDWHNSDPQQSNYTDDQGAQSYKRFKSLLVEEFDKPSIPSAAALLLVGATLISQGRSSAGWTLSGTAHRMIMDLGCHMIIGPDWEGQSTTGRLLRRDIEQEMRKRIYWGAYVSDAAQALYLGRPCMFSCIEARVPLQFLDTFEELELWDPSSECGSSSGTVPSCEPQPAYAVSTFMSMARLLRVSTKITELYGIQSIKLNGDTLLDKWRSIEWELDNWRTSLSPHLQVDEDSTSAPPPHQITPHTTFHALTILLHRAFMEEGHLRRHSDQTAKRRGEDACVKSALAIEKYVRMYRNAFSLRRAPFLLSYAAYSAVTVILHQEQQNRGQFAEKISFFWTCLNELHRGSNLGLKKPLKIIQDVVRELQINIDQGSLLESEQQLQPSLDESSFSALGNLSGSGLTPGNGSFSISNLSTASEWNNFDQTGPMYGMSPMGFLNGQENDISHDTLYGLFAPTHTYS